ISSTRGSIRPAIYVLVARGFSRAINFFPSFAREGRRSTRLFRKRARRRSHRRPDRRRPSRVRRGRARRRRIGCRLHRGKNPRSARLPRTARLGEAHESLGRGRRRFRPGRFAVHARRRLPQGTAAFVRRCGGAGARARARRSRRQRAAERGPARRDRRVPGHDAGVARQRRPGDAPARQPETVLTTRGFIVRVSRAAVFVCAIALGAVNASAQQRPLVTEDAETIGAGRILIEGGLDFAHNQDYPVSGLRGDLWRIPTIGISIGLSSIAELQIDGGPFDRLTINERRAAPLSSLVTATGTTTHDVEDIVVATKIRVGAEGPGRPALGIRFATKLPNASNESGLGLDTTDFYGSLLGAKTVQSVRVVANIGFGIMSDPTNGNRQNDVLT